MTNTYKPHLDQQPTPKDDLKKQQALDTDREKPSSDPVEFEEDSVNFEDHKNRLGGDPDVPRELRKVGGQDNVKRQSQKQSQS